MSAPGYMGKVLHVDLRSEEFETKKLDLDVARDYVGGLGLNAWLMEQVYVTGTDPLSPDNPIILGAGPLVGTNTPGAAKIVATTRFPLNGTISESVGSMRFALNVKGAGFDHLIITGRSKKPVVLVLEDDKASFMDAKELWGLDIFEGSGGQGIHRWSGWPGGGHGLKEPQGDCGHGGSAPKDP
jgi:aldehyde:ferredoxin oxidoreductase